MWYFCGVIILASTIQATLISQVCKLKLFRSWWSPASWTQPNTNILISLIQTDHSECYEAVIRANVQFQIDRRSSPLAGKIGFQHIGKSFIAQIDDIELDFDPPEFFSEALRTQILYLNTLAARRYARTAKDYEYNRIKQVIMSRREVRFNLHNIAIGPVLQVCMYYLANAKALIDQFRDTAREMFVSKWELRLTSKAHLIKMEIGHIIKLSGPSNAAVSNTEKTVFEFMLNDILAEAKSIDRSMSEHKMSKEFGAVIFKLDHIRSLFLRYKSSKPGNNAVTKIRSWLKYVQSFIKISTKG